MNMIKKENEENFIKVRPNWSPLEFEKEIEFKSFDKNKFDYVFHLAAYAAEGLSHFIKRFNLKYFRGGG